MKPRHLPDLDRLSVIAATILLSYALARFINLPGKEFPVQLPGLFFTIKINFQTVVTLIVAGLTMAGADWLLRDHPEMYKERVTIEHWLAPGLTAMVIGLPLLQVSPGLVWWIGFASGGALLMAVLVSEYISVDPEDARHPTASAALTAVSFALFLILAITLRFAETRLLFIMPALWVAAWLVCLRTLHLRLQGRWALIESGVVAFVIGQLAAALYYLPLSPIAYSLLLLGPAYGLTSLIAALADGQPWKKAILEPLLVIILVWGAAFWLK